MKSPNLVFILLSLLSLCSCRNLFVIDPVDSLEVVPSAVIVPENVTPLQLTQMMQHSLAKVRKATVSIEIGGSASGVVISPNGYILTAAHVMRGKKGIINGTATFDNGKEVKIQSLGYDWQADIAMFKVLDAKEKLPFIKLANKSPDIDAFCFTLAHPTGRIAGRLAQVRIGRITSIIKEKNLPMILVADCNIQPGDSGGPLFDLNGNLIGIDSSAAGFVGMNMFAAIDQFHNNNERFFNGDVWGDAALGVTNSSIYNGKMTDESFKAMQAEFSKRVKINYRPVMDKIRDKITSKGELKVNKNDIINALGKDVYPLVHNNKVGLGMLDPKLLKQIVPLPKESVRPLPIKGGWKTITHGLAVTKHHLLVKLSDIEDVKMVLRLKPGTKSLRKVAKNRELDLALLYTGEKLTLRPVTWAKKQPQIKAGDLLIYPDIYGRLTWGNAMGIAYEVKKGGSMGPMKDKSLISKYRVPYKRVIPHSLPLFANDAVTPVYTSNGELVGVHIARLNRTTGLIMLADDLQKVVEKMLISCKK